MESIVQAKDRQAAEANKNASILLEELDLEKVRNHPSSEVLNTLTTSMGIYSGLGPENNLKKKNPVENFAAWNYLPLATLRREPV